VSAPAYTMDIVQRLTAKYRAFTKLCCVYNRLQS